MPKKFELWLDESGDFQNEAALRARNMKPSLVGGILLEKEIAAAMDVDSILDEEHNHAMEFSDEQKRLFSLPVLERLQTEYHAREVFFENAGYADGESNRQLYLKVMAEGLIQLLQTLNAAYESVLIEVIIAQRQDVEKMGTPASRISDAEYIAKLNDVMKRKRRLRRLLLHEDSELKFIIQPAHRQKKLQMADFACNTRLTRDSRAFQGSRDRVERLYEDALIFTMAERSSENYIRTSLTQGYISDAVMELYTTLDSGLDRRQMTELIISRMKNENYRILKAQLKQCSSDLVAYAAMQDDYEVGEGLFKDIRRELLARMHEEKIPCPHFEFTLLLWLTDHLLREGAIIEARESLAECRAVQESFGTALEDVFTYYQLLEKESLLAIDEFNFEKGREIMRLAGETFSGLMHFLMENPNLKQRFPAMKSEYFGDALCMELYAAMFLLREKPSLYQELCVRSDLAMTQYPNQKGELERHRQYRSRIELEHGNYLDAIRYLFLAKEFRPRSGNGTSEAGEDGGLETLLVNKETLWEFLDLVGRTEVTVSCQYYLMYYLLILSEAQYGGQTELAEVMYEALGRNEKLKEAGGLITSQNPELQTIDTRGAKKKKSGVLYHPLEIVAWKYASFLFQIGKYQTADHFFTKALNMCFAHSNYVTMEITGIGASAEYIANLVKSGEPERAREQYGILLGRIDAVRKQALQPETLHFVESLEKLLKESKNEKGLLEVQSLIAASRKITY